MTSEYELFKNLIDLSRSKVWETAKKEWTLVSIEYLSPSEQYETCICGKEDIRCVCTIYNIKTENTAKIGRCCINKIFNWAVRYVTIKDCKEYRGE